MPLTCHVFSVIFFSTKIEIRKKVGTSARMKLRKIHFKACYNRHNPLVEKLSEPTEGNHLLIAAEQDFTTLNRPK